MSCAYCGTWSSAFEPQLWKLRCDHCGSEFELCARHRLVHAQTHASPTGHPVTVCPTCVGWDSSTFKGAYKGTECARCKASLVDPLDDATFLSLRGPRDTSGEMKMAAIDPDDERNVRMEAEKELGHAPTGPLEAFFALSQSASKIVLGSSVPKILRIVSWNIQDLGGGFKGMRSADVLRAIATLIHAIDPHICVIIEVLKKKGVAIKKKKSTKRRRKKGKRGATSTPIVPTAPIAHPGVSEVDKIVTLLKALGGNWLYQTHPTPEYTGGGSETYAYIFKNEGDIAVDPATVFYIDKDTGGNDLHFPTARHRRPMQAVFQLQNKLASNGKPWKLPIVAFHAPAQHAGDGVDPIPMQAYENLAKIALTDPTDSDYKAGNEFAEHVIAADLNINFDFYSGITGGDDPASVIKQSKYAQKAELVGDELKIDTLIGQEISRQRTTLKQVSYHFQIEDYDDKEEWVDPENCIPEEHIDTLYQCFKEWKGGAKPEGYYTDALSTLMSGHYDVPTDKTEADDLARELKKEADDVMMFLATEEMGGGSGAPSSTFDYCNNSFDKLALVQKHGFFGPSPKCIVKDAQAFVFPLLAAVMPRLKLSGDGSFFRWRDAQAEYGAKSRLDPARMDGLLYSTLERDYASIYQKTTGESVYSEAKLTPTMCLKVANKLSDHLPLIIDLYFD